MCLGAAASLFPDGLSVDSPCQVACVCERERGGGRQQVKGDN